MKFTHIAVGATKYEGHVLYALDENGDLWKYTPHYVSPMGHSRPEQWSPVHPPEQPRGAYVGF